MKQLKQSLLIISFIWAFACSEDKHGPLSDKGNTPASVNNVSVENLSGAARISYSLPVDVDILYVKAEFYRKKGELVTVKASSRVNNLLVEGLNDTNEREVKLYTVSKSEKVSAPVSVKINPLSPPLANIYKSLETESTFGGVRVRFRNETKANIVFTVMRYTDQGDWQELDRHYTSQQENAFATRGMEDKETLFGLVVKDRWDNYSDTLKVSLTPLKEEVIDKKKWMDSRYPGEMVDQWADRKLYALWDDKISNAYYQSKYDLPLPVSFTINLGTKAKLNRFKIWQRCNPAHFMFGGDGPRRWELWGSNNPDPDGGYDNWILLGEYIMVKPSGQPLGANTDEDIAVAKAGQEFDIQNLDAPAIQYFRFKQIDSWSVIGGGNGAFHLEEITLWGTSIE